MLVRKNLEIKLCINIPLKFLLAIFLHILNLFSEPYISFNIFIS